MVPFRDVFVPQSHAAVAYRLPAAARVVGAVQRVPVSQRRPEAALHVPVLPRPRSIKRNNNLAVRHDLPADGGGEWSHRAVGAKSDGVVPQHGDLSAATQPDGRATHQLGEAELPIVGLFLVVPVSRNPSDRVQRRPSSSMDRSARRRAVSSRYRPRRRSGKPSSRRNDTNRRDTDSVSRRTHVSQQGLDCGGYDPQ